MKHLLNLILVLTLLLSGCGVKNWDSKDKALYGVLTGLLVVDALQTRDIYEDEARTEANPVINMWFDSKNASSLYMLGAGITIGVIADNLPRKYRTPFLSGIVAIEGYTVIRNNHRGVGFEF